MDLHADINAVVYLVAEYFRISSTEEIPLPRIEAPR
jgi:hypothetical protein